MPINIRFPVVDDPNSNFLFDLSKTTKDALRSNLLLLLLTDKGERYYLPDFGTNLNTFIFDPQDANTLKAIEEDIKLTVGKYIPQLIIKTVNFFSIEDGEDRGLLDNQIEIEVVFNYTNDVFSPNQSVILTKTK